MIHFTLPALPCPLPLYGLLLLDPQDAATGGGQQVIQASGLQPPGHCGGVVDRVAAARKVLQGQHRDHPWL